MSGGAALSPCTCEPFASHSSLMFAFVIPCSTSISAYSLSERAFSASVAAPFSTVLPIISTISTWSFHFSFCRCEISCGMPFALWIAHFTLQNLMSQPSCHGDRTFSPSFTLPFGIPAAARCAQIMRRLRRNCAHNCAAYRCRFRAPSVGRRGGGPGRRRRRRFRTTWDLYTGCTCSCSLAESGARANRPRSSP